MVPTTLEGWTLDAVRQLLVAGVFEHDRFDFNEQLPHSQEKSGKEGLATSCAAFANAGGGFLVFGVADDKGLAPDDRLVGVNAKDFPEQFGHYPARCLPSVDWDFKKAGLALPSGKLIHIVEIPRSWRAPHCVQLPDNAFRFPKRTNKGNEHMPFSEVQAMFLGLQEKRRKLEMLRAELAFLRDLVSSISPKRVEASETTTITPPMAVLQVLVGETYVLLERDPKLLESLNRVRRLALDIEEAHADYQRKLSSPTVNVGVIEWASATARNHNADLARYCDWMAAAITDAQARLNALLG